MFLRFTPFYGFINRLSENLAKCECKINCNYLRNHFKYTSDVFQKTEDFKEIRKKGIYPHEYINSYEKINDTKLPSIDEFYSRLTGKNVSEEEYIRAKYIWKLFKCQTLLYYPKLYLRSDVLIYQILLKILKNVCLNNYKLDPLHFFSAPGLTCEAFLKHSKSKIPLFSDKDMYTFIEKGTGGGVSQYMKDMLKRIIDNEIL